MSLLRIAAAHQARRVVLAGAHPVERLGHRPAVAALPAAASTASCRAPRSPCPGRCPACWCSSSMFWVTTARSLPCRSSSTIARWPAFGSASHAGESQPVLPREPAHLRVGEVVLQRRRLLGRRVLRPHPVRPAEVGDARVGRDAGAGEHGDALGLGDPLPSALESSTDRRQHHRAQSSLGRCALHATPHSSAHFLGRVAVHLGMASPVSRPRPAEEAVDGNRSDGHSSDRPAADGRAVARPGRRPVGYDVRSQYVELFWLDVLGPTATWLLRRLVPASTATREATSSTSTETATRARPVVHGRHCATVHATLNRCVLFGVRGRPKVGLPCAGASRHVATRHLMRMPAHLRQAHQQWSVPTTRISLADLERARVLAEAMVATGDDPRRWSSGSCSPLGVTPRPRSRQRRWRSAAATPPDAA